MTSDSSSCPPSQALTFCVTVLLMPATRARCRPRKQPHEERENLARLDQHVERQQQDGDEAEETADDIADVAKDRRGDTSPARRCGRLLHRVAQRDRLAQDADAHQELLSLLDLLRQVPPQLFRLVDQRRHDGHADADERADDRRVNQQDRKPARQPRADGNRASAARSSAPAARCPWQTAR